jgi:hypothetical protein
MAGYGRMRGGRDPSDILGGEYSQAPGALMGGDQFSEDMVMDMLLGTGGQYAPGGQETPPMFPGTGDPIQDYIRMQLAGDVVPMYPGGNRDVMDRLSQPVYSGSRGAASINQAGGPSSPYLDLLNILAFPGGGSMAPPMRRR